MEQLILILHFLVAVALIGFILIQHGKGADIGAAFGSGASQTVFGSKGSGGFLMKLTLALGALFFITSITLTFLASRDAKQAQKTTLLNDVEQISQYSKQAEQNPAVLVTKQQNNAKKTAVTTKNNKTAKK